MANIYFKLLNSKFCKLNQESASLIRMQYRDNDFRFLAEIDCDNGKVLRQEYKGSASQRRKNMRKGIKMQANIKKENELNETKALEERIQRLKYDLVSNYKSQKSIESILMFVMDV